MQSIAEKNKIYRGAHHKLSVYDLAIPEIWNRKLIIFIHGYMGFKDWGAWHLVEQFFTSRGYGFVKYNVSHNGATVEQPFGFSDLDSFSKNNYLKEVEDFEAILETIKKRIENPASIFLIGHSRGGGIALLQSRNPSIKKIGTLAAISSIASRFPEGEELITWKSTGVWYRQNGRTKQNMPHLYSQFTNFLDHQERLSIEYYVKHANCPMIFIHGEEDLAVNISDGEQLSIWANTELVRITNTQHTFGAEHPWLDHKLPVALDIACEHLFAFFEQSQ